MKPDVIFINHALVLPLLRQETHTIPIVFVQVTDPVADGLVDDASSSRCSAARWPLGRSRQGRSSR